MPVVDSALALAKRYLPAGAAGRLRPPSIAVAVFADDAFLVGANLVLVDLEFTCTNAPLIPLVAHEFHHAFAARASRMRLTLGDDPRRRLVQILGNARSEGIADMIDKTYPLPVGQTEISALYAKTANQAFAQAPVALRSMDSLLAIAAGDSSRLADVSSRIQRLLPASGHFAGSYVARAIVDTFGVDSLLPGVVNPFAFWRTFATAEVRRGRPRPFSPKSQALLDSLEGRFVLP